MGQIKGTALSIVILLIGLGMASTAVTQFSAEGTDLVGSVICGFLGLFMIFGSAIIFKELALPHWKDKSHTLKDDFDDLVIADQTGAADSDETDALISSFRASLRDFFAARGMPENSALQSTVTQMLWHILHIQKRRIEAKGISMDFSAVRKSYGGRSVEKQQYFDGKYMITDARERIAAERTYLVGGKPAFTKKDDELAHYGIVDAKRTSDGDSIICPDCGNPTTRENLLDGCDYCGTKFTVEDLGSRVSSFALRGDYQIAYDKYRDSRRYYGMRAFLIGAVPGLVISVIGMLSVADELEADPVMTMVASVFSAAFCAACFGGLAMGIFWTAIFPFVQTKKYVGYRSKKKLEERKKRESQNMTLTSKIRGFDPLFSTEAFFSNIQNKLAAIHYASRADEVRAFAVIPLENIISAYEDVVDMDVTEFGLLDFYIDDSMQYIEMKADISLLHARESRFFRSSETIRFALAKSALCKTEAVCGPSMLKCKGCGASISLLDGGRCAYCGTELRLWEYDWVITQYEAHRGD